MDLALRRLAERITRMEGQIKSATTTPQLAYSSIMDGWLSAYVGEQITLRIGLQHDGTSTTGVISGPTPPTPTPPFITERAGGLSVYWDGTFTNGGVAPMDYSRVTVYAVPSDGFVEFDPLDQTTIVGEIASATGGEVTVGLDQVEYLVFLVAWSQAGKFSAPSDPGIGTPLEGELVVDQTARDLAQQALDAANAAADFAESAIKVFYQDDEPAAADSAEGYIWFDTNDGRRQHVYHGGAWVDAQDADVAAAISAAAAAESSAAAAETTLDGWTFNGTTDINGGKIHTDSITTNQLAANAITSKHTITGALFQTTDTAARGIKFGSAGLTAWNSSGVSTFTIDATTGNVTMLGSLTTGSQVTGAIVTGGVVQTTTTAARGIKLNTTNLIAYNTSGSPTFSIDANTGNVSMLGTLTSGSTITGASITASTLRTATGGGRVEVGLTDNTGASNSAAVSFWASTSALPGAIYSGSGNSMYIYPPKTDPSLGSGLITLWSGTTPEASMYSAGVMNLSSQDIRIGKWTSDPGATLDLVSDTITITGPTTVSGTATVNPSLDVYGPYANGYFRVRGFASANGTSDAAMFAGTSQTTFAFGNSGWPRLTFNDNVQVILTNLPSQTGQTVTRNSSTGALGVTGSARAVKVDIHDLADAPNAIGSSILDLTPVRYRDRDAVERYQAEMDDEDPRFWLGMIAEEFVEAGWEDLVLRDSEGAVNTLMYDRLICALIPELRAMRDRIDQLEARAVA